MFARLRTARELVANSNCSKIIKASFIDLNSMIDKYHIGVVQFQCSVIHD